MADNTEYHNWERPDVYADVNAWGYILNDTLDEIDTSVILKDTMLNRPNPGTPGVWFYATDENTVYYDTGEEWIVVFGQRMENQDVEFGSIDASSGTAAQPSYAFKSDSDTGVYSPGSDNLALVTGGVRAIQADGNQDVDVVNGNLYVQGNRVATRTWVNSSASIANSSLDNSTLTVAGNPVGLGGSTGIAHSDLSSIGSADHHPRYTNEEVMDVVNNLLMAGTNISLTYDDVNNTLTIDSTVTRYTDEETQDAVNAMLTGGTDVSTTYDDANNTLTIDYTGTTYTDEEARDAAQAMFGSQFTVDDANDTVTLNEGEGSGLNTDLLDGYDIQKNGTDGTGVINFKTN